MRADQVYTMVPSRAYETAKEYMLNTYGKPIDLPAVEKDKWHERLGMLIDFIDSQIK
jgi:hypothetical protein